jgi:hypothetical protein
LIDDLLLRRQELQKEIADIGTSPSEPLRSIVRKKVIPHFVSFGYLLRQYFKREALPTMLATARREFDGELQQLQAEKDRDQLTHAIEASATLRRVDALIYLHRIVKWWLPPHVATTSLMLALMIVHIIQVIYYASR